MEQDEQWEEGEEVSLQGRRPRNRNNITTTTTSNGSIPLKPANGTGSPNEEEAADEKLNDNSKNIIVVDDAAGNGEGRLKKSVYFDKDKDTESTYGFSGMQYSSTGCSVSEAKPRDQELDVTEKNFDIGKSLSAVIKHQYEENLKNESLSGFSLLPSEKSCEEQNTSFKPLNNGSIEKADVILIKESDQEVTTLDVERVLAKQDTHDLYCPNCNSCITRRVILRKRKRKIGHIQHKAKRDKFETKVDSELDADPAYSANGKGHDTVDICLDGSPTPAVSDNNHDREPDIFRCLSCFSFFIPSGNGIKLFRIFGDSNENEDMQNPRQISATNANWLFSIFASDKGKMAIEQGDAAQDHSEVDTVKQLDTSCFSDDMLPRHESDHPVTPLAGGTLVNTGEPAKDAILKPQQGGAAQDHSEVDTVLYQRKEVDTVKHLNSSCFSDHMLPHNESDYPVTQLAGRTLVNTEEPAEDSTLKPQLGGLKILVPSTAVSLMLEKSQINLKERSDVEIRNETIPDQNGHTSSIQGAPLPVQSFCAGGLVNEVNTQSWEAGKESVVSSTQGSILLKKVMTYVGERSDDAVEKNNTGDDVILIVEAGAVQAAGSQRAQSIIVSGETVILPGTQINEGEQEGAEVSEVQRWDILKSIVYGGLIESITSLGVVSSAAGADAATLNVLALGLANLIGGLFIIGHDLRELKNDHSGGASNQINQQVDRYQDVLGQRENFILHATVAVLSFLIFGLVPPVIYGFSFRKSDSRELKLGAVMAASLLCIILLAIGKCHIRKPPKSYIKTVLYYISLGLMASGISYIVGSLIKKLLEKFGWFESSSVVSVPFPETGPAWASY